MGRLIAGVMFPHVVSVSLVVVSVNVCVLCLVSVSVSVSVSVCESVREREREREREFISTFQSMFVCRHASPTPDPHPLTPTS